METDKKIELTYEERVKWFINNYYETGMEYELLLETMKDKDLNNFKWYNDVISIPRYKVESKFGSVEVGAESSAKKSANKLNTFVERMKRIGIEVRLIGNFPWVYLDEINGIKVTETFLGNHGFTVMFLPPKNGAPVSEFTGISEMFKLIRKYVKEDKEN